MEVKKVVYTASHAATKGVLSEPGGKGIGTIYFTTRMQGPVQTYPSAFRVSPKLSAFPTHESALLLVKIPHRLPCHAGYDNCITIY